MTVRIGADVGGTFTDVVLIDDNGNVWTHKVLSSPPDPSLRSGQGFEQAVLEAIEHLLREKHISGDAVSQVAHGTTVATNAVLEHRGARTALITTQGFRDVLELRCIRAPQMYDLFWEKPAPLVERYLRLELNERVSADGTVLKAIDETELHELAAKLRREKVESLAVCLIHSYAFPQHEKHVGEFLQTHLPDVPVSLSHEILPTMISTSMRAGETIYHRLAGGGGFGDPFTRAPQLVARDARNGKISVNAAREEYGVVLDGETFEVDEQAANDERRKTSER